MENINTLIRISYEMYLQSKISTFPASPYELANRLGIPIKEADEASAHYKAIGKDISLLVLKGNMAHIYLKSHNGSTIGPIFHEISHFQLKHIYDGPEKEAEANLLTMIHRVPPIFLRKYKGNKLNFIMYLSGCNRQDAKEYLQKIKEAGFRNLQTSLDNQMCVQFDAFMQEHIKPSVKKIVFQSVISILLAFLCIAFGAAMSSQYGNYKTSTADNEASALEQRFKLLQKLPDNAPYSQPEGLERSKEGQIEQPEALRMVYIYPTGHRYHYNPNCQGIGSTEVSLENALELKRTPCSFCVFD